MERSSRKCKTCDTELVSKRGAVRFVYAEVSLEITGPLFVCEECGSKYIDFLVIFMPDNDRGTVDARINEEVRGNA